MNKDLTNNPHLWYETDSIIMSSPIENEKFNGVCFSHLDKENNKVYFHISYSEFSLKNYNNYIKIAFDINNSENSYKFFIDSNGFINADKNVKSSFKVCTNFYTASEQGQEIYADIEFCNKKDKKLINDISLILYVNGNQYNICKNLIFDLSEEETTEKSTKVTEKTTEKTTVKTTERTTVKITEKTTVKSTEKTTEKAAEKTTEKTAERYTDSNNDNTAANNLPSEKESTTKFKYVPPKDGFSSSNYTYSVDEFSQSVEEFSLTAEENLSREDGETESDSSYKTETPESSVIIAEPESGNNLTPVAKITIAISVLLFILGMGLLLYSGLNKNKSGNIDKN